MGQTGLAAGIRFKKLHLYINICQYINLSHARGLILLTFILTEDRHSPELHFGFQKSYL